MDPSSFDEKIKYSKTMSCKSRRKSNAEMLILSSFCQGQCCRVWTPLEFNASAGDGASDGVCPL